MRIMNVDFMGCLHWHYHAKDNQITFRFLKTLREIVQKFQIDRTFLLLEGGSKYRAKLHPQYKAARKKRREEMSDSDKAEYQRFITEADAFVNDIAPLFALTPLRIWGAEADDLAGYLCNHIDTEEHQIFNLSGDQDWYQLLRKNVVQGSYVEIKNAQRDRQGIPNTIWLSRSGFVKRYEIQVQDWIWKKCLTGDTGDSVPGFPKLGETTALSLLQQYGSIEAIEKNKAELHVPHMRKEAKEALTNNFDLVYRNYPIMNLNFSPEEEIEIFGEAGIEYLDREIARLSEEKQVNWRDLQEVIFERGWLEVDENWMSAFLRQ